jgi:hypothetical protein
MNQGIMRRLLIGAAVALMSCEPSGDEGLPSGPCVEDVNLRAYVDQAPTSTGAWVFGETSAPAGVTVRAVHVAGKLVPLSDFNYRGFQFHVPQQLLEAAAVDGLATLSVVAYTSTGCDDLQEGERPQVRVGGGEAGAAGTADVEVDANPQ